LRADLVPDEFRAEALAAALSTHTTGKRVLLVRASRGRETLAEDLRSAGARVGQVVVYTSRDVEQADAGISAALAAGKIDWVTVSSSAIARSLAKLFGDALRNTKLASISPITSGVLRELGFEPAVEATEYTMAGLAEAIAASSAQRNQRPS
jgi:uroporphyrinogen III methyltransferase/synthase